MSSSYKEILNSQLPDIYKINNLESNAIGNSIDRVQTIVDGFEKEMIPKTAESYGLEFWESFFKLPSNENESISTRRARVISELIQFVSDENVIRKEEMENIIALYTDGCEVVEDFANYYFDVVMNFVGIQDEVSIREVNRTIKKVKPSWLEYGLTMEIKFKDSNIYAGSYLSSGETVTIYPWSVSEISSKAKISLGTSNYDVETVEIYPKEVI